MKAGIVRLATYSDSTGTHVGVVRGDRIVDIQAVAGDAGSLLPSDVLSLIDAGPEVLRSVEARLHGTDQKGMRALAEVTLRPPLIPRENVMAIGRNYAAHAEESARASGEEVAPTTIFTKALTSLTGPYDDIEVDPELTREVDFEAELGVVIGRSGRDIPVCAALDHVFGYTVINDVSARNIQFGAGGQYFKGKSLDGFCPIGPWIVTRDEIPDPQRLTVRCAVNGEPMQEASTSTMILSVAELVAELSRGMTLLAGNIIATGTPAGVGYARTPPRYLQDGDIVQAEVDAIGSLRNRILFRR